MSRTPRESVAFDRAADYYDATRSLSPETAAQVTTMLVDALDGHHPVLEIGVGTGRIAVPLVEAGLEVVGIDLADPMLRELTAKTAALPVVRGDCTVLPFCEDHFGAVVASHVFHLVPEWRASVIEVLRVLRPDGALLFSRGGLGARSVAPAVVFAEAAGIDRTPVGLAEVEGLDAYLRSRQWVGEWLPVIDDEREITIDGLIDLMASGVMGWTWSASDEDRARGAAATRAWADEQGLPRDEPHRFPQAVRFRRYQAMAP